MNKQRNKYASGTDKRKGWFHTTVKPSSDSLPGHVILDMSSRARVTQMSCFES